MTVVNFGDLILNNDVATISRINCLNDDFIISADGFAEKGVSKFNCYYFIDISQCPFPQFPNMDSSSYSDLPSLAAREVSWLTQAEALLIGIKENLSKVPVIHFKDFQNSPAMELSPKKSPESSVVRAYFGDEPIEFGSGIFNRLAMLIDPLLVPQQNSQENFKDMRNRVFSSFLVEGFKFKYAVLFKNSFYLSSLALSYSKSDFEGAQKLYEAAWSKYDSRVSLYSKRLSLILPGAFKSACLTDMIAYYAIDFKSNFDIATIFDSYLNILPTKKKELIRVIRECIKKDQKADQTKYLNPEELEVRIMSFYQRAFLQTFEYFVLNYYGSGITFEGYLKENESEWSTPTLKEYSKNEKITKELQKLAMRSPASFENFREILYRITLREIFY